MIWHTRIRQEDLKSENVKIKFILKNKKETIQQELHKKSNKANLHSVKHLEYKFYQESFGLLGLRYFLKW